MRELTALMFALLVGWIVGSSSAIISLALWAPPNAPLLGFIVGAAGAFGGIIVGGYVHLKRTSV